MRDARIRLAFFLVFYVPTLRSGKLMPPHCCFSTRDAFSMSFTFSTSPIASLSRDRRESVSLNEQLRFELKWSRKPRSDVTRHNVVRGQAQGRPKNPATFPLRNSPLHLSRSCFNMRVQDDIRQAIMSRSFEVENVYDVSRLALSVRYIGINRL